MKLFNSSLGLSVSGNGFVMKTQPSLFWYFKFLSKQAGWTIPRSWDGFENFDDTGNDVVEVHDGEPGTAGTVQNSTCWWVQRAPNGLEICVYLDHNGQVWLQYSPGGLFTGGSSAPPTATDARNIVGYDTTANGTVHMVTGGANIKAAIMCDSAAPYGWWILSGNVTTGAPEMLVMMDPIARGTETEGDTDLYAFVAQYSATNPGSFYNGAAGHYPHAFDEDQPYVITGSSGALASGYGAKGFLKKGLPGEAWRSFAWAPHGNFNNFIVNQIGVNPANNKDQLIPCVYAASRTLYNATTGWKGVSSLVWFVSNDRNTNDTFNVDGGTKNYAYFEGMAVNWNGTDPTF